MAQGRQREARMRTHGWLPPDWRRQQNLQYLILTEDTVEQNLSRALSGFVFQTTVKNHPLVPDSASRSAKAGCNNISKDALPLVATAVPLLT